MEETVLPSRICGQQRCPINGGRAAGVEDFGGDYLFDFLRAYFTHSLRLQISDSGDTSAIRASYLKMVSQWHPDRFQVTVEEERKIAAEKFRNITDAYNLLKEVREV